MLPGVSYIHIHKCAGHSLLSFLSNPFGAEQISPPNKDYQYADPASVRKDYKIYAGHIRVARLRELGIDNLIVTSLREPVKRLASAYSFFHQRGRVRYRKIQNGLLAVEDVPRTVLKLRKMSFEEALESDDPDIVDSFDNIMARVLSGASYGDSAQSTTIVCRDRRSDAEIVADAKRTIDSLDAVFYVENLTEDMRAFAKRFGWPPVEESPRLNAKPVKWPARMGRAYLPKLESYTWMDYEIWRHALERFPVDKPLSRTFSVPEGMLTD